MPNKRIIYRLAFIFSVVLTGILLVIMTLPRIVEHRLGGYLSSVLNSDPVQFRVKQIGFSQVLAADIRLADGISIDSIAVDFKWRGFSMPEISLVRLSGVTLRTRMGPDNQIHIQGFHLPKSSEQQQTRLNTAVVPKKLVLNHGKLILTAVGNEWIIPFNIMADVETEDSRMTIRSDFYPLGQTVHVLSQYGFESGIQYIRVASPSFHLPALNPLVSALTGTTEAGSIPFLFGTTNVRVESRAPKTHWNIDVSNLPVHPVQNLSMEGIAATLKISDKQVRINGNFNLSGIGTEALPFSMTGHIDQVKRSGIAFDARLESKQIKAFEIEQPGSRIQLTQPEISAHFFGNLKSATGNIHFRSAGGDAVHNSHSVGFGAVNLESGVTADYSHAPLRVNSRTRLDVKKIRAESGPATVAFAGLKILGQAGYETAAPLNGRITLEAVNGTFQSRTNQIRAAGIEIRLPYAFPAPDQKENGSFSIPVISDQKGEFQGWARGRISQTGLRSIDVQGTGGLKHPVGFKARYQSEISYENDLVAKFKLAVDPFTITHTDVKPMMGPMAQDAQFSARVSARADAAVTGRQMDSSLVFSLDQGQFGLPASKMKTSGIRTTVEITDLLNFRSRPGQIMTIDSIDINRVKISDAKIRYSIEGPKSVLFENIRFKWCNGLVSSEAVRFPNPDNHYQLTLYCDRLELASLLEQMGAFRAEGDGTLSGRIPVTYSDGDISFDDGFLFSTPGSSGRVAIENTEVLTAGIPMDSPQFFQLDLAREALKDFDYKWAKLRLNTTGDTLAVAMELDGKPSGTLPFQYQKDFGGFVRVDAESPGSNFQGIKLDVNLKLPFNEVMKFGNKLRSVLK
ncbi:MAG: YdbH domain-containing protein [Desulfobacterales bacterium]|nr:YdbH domain-containing protein [Desulfobacterales bacterium]